MSDPDDPPTSINPYSVLSLSKSASPAEIKSAYKKLALRLHPDKVPQADRSAAHTKFQQLALAYAILSDLRRKKRYDATGSTADSLDLDEDDFDWTSFFRAQYTDLVTVDKLSNLKNEYQESEQEKQDILAAFTAAKGKMKVMYDRIMMSSMLADEDRFRRIIDEAISNGKVEGFSAYLNETAKQKEKRRKKALVEQREAEEHARDLGIHNEVYGLDSKENKVPSPQTKKTAASSESDLAILIQQRVKGRMENFLGSLEEKFATKSKTGGRGNKNRTVILDQPPEEAFEAMVKRGQKGGTEANESAKTIPAKATKRGKKRSASVLVDDLNQAGRKSGEDDQETDTASTKKRMKRQGTRTECQEDE